MKFFGSIYVSSTVWVEQFPEGTVNESCVGSDGIEVRMGDLVLFGYEKRPAIFLGEKLESDHMFQVDARGQRRLIWYRYFLGSDGLFIADGQWPLRLLDQMASE